MSDDLKLAVENLTLKDKVELREYLSDMIASSRGGVMRSPLRCSILLREVASVMCVPCIPIERRDPDSVWARAIVAYQMCREGYTTIEIGRQMMKNHSTIIHLRDKMQDVFEMPFAYRDIIEIWNDFQKRIEQ